MRQRTPKSRQRMHLRPLYNSYDRHADKRQERALFDDLFQTRRAAQKNGSMIGSVNQNRLRQPNAIISDQKVLRIPKKLISQRPAGIPKQSLILKEQRETHLRTDFDSVEQQIVQQRGGLYDRYENLNIKNHPKQRRKIGRHFHSMEHNNDEFLHNRARINNSALSIHGSDLIEMQRGQCKGAGVQKKNHIIFDQRTQNLKKIQRLSPHDKRNIVKNLQVNYNYGPIRVKRYDSGMNQRQILQLYLNKRHMSRQCLQERRVKLAALICMPEEYGCNDQGHYRYDGGHFFEE